MTNPRTEPKTDEEIMVSKGFALMADVAQLVAELAKRNAEYARLEELIVKLAENPGEHQTATTQAEYEALPTGSIVAYDENRPWVKHKHDEWLRAAFNGSVERSTSAQISRYTRAVLRHGQTVDAPVIGGW